MISLDVPDKGKMVDAAVRTGVFRDKEISILEELIDDMLGDKETTYRSVSAYTEGILSAFAILGRTPLTDFSWDIYWLVVSPEFQGKGIGARILHESERIMTENSPEAVIRVETSTRSEYLPARRFYLNKGFREVGIIEDFYARQDGIVIYAKNINPDFAKNVTQVKGGV